MTTVSSPPPLFPSGTNQISAPGGPSAPPATETAALSSDFETFLKMLTVQMQNQDPLNPVDSTDYATQLATFSSVEQQVKSNDLLTDIGAQLGIGSLQQVGAWIGMQALTYNPVRFDDGPVTVRPEVAQDADRAVLVAFDEAGDVLDRTSLDLDADVFVWRGQNGAGQPFAADAVRFQVESFADDVLLSNQPAAAYSLIEEVRTESGQVLVRLSDGSEVAAARVTGLRSAPSTAAGT